METNVGGFLGQVNNPPCQKCRLSARNKSNIYFCQTNTHLGFGGKKLGDGVFRGGLNVEELWESGGR